MNFLHKVRDRIDLFVVRNLRWYSRLDLYPQVAIFGVALVAWFVVLLNAWRLPFVVVLLLLPLVYLGMLFVIEMWDIIRSK
jgi:hypothetical protein